MAGVWKTIKGRKVFIEEGETPTEAINKSLNKDYDKYGELKRKETQEIDASDSESLSGVRKLFYRKREDGSYYVQGLDYKNEMEYEGTFYNKRSMERTLGKNVSDHVFSNAESNSNDFITIKSIPKETDYMMSHRPTESGAYGYDISSKGNYVSKDIYTNPQYYGDIRSNYIKESVSVLKSIRNNPNAEVIIYRATTGNKINEGDWVTLSKDYAKVHNNSQLDGKGNIVKLKVKAKDIQWAGDSLAEFGYYPKK